MVQNVKVRLVDAPEDAGRTTATLFASLASRLITLHYTSGVSVVGSTLVGLAQIGREISRTAEGARMRSAIEAHAAARNGETVWKVLRIADWTNGMPASPILDHVRNDLGLLLAGDLDEVVNNIPVPQETRTARSAAEPQDLNFVDTLMGLWVYSREICRAVEALADEGAEENGVFRADGIAGGTLLR